MSCTFKEDDIWILLKRDPSTLPDTVYFMEKSSYGIFQGQIEIIEN